jgi:hypothetical protein
MFPHCYHFTTLYELLYVLTLFNLVQISLQFRLSTSGYQRKQSASSIWLAIQHSTHQVLSYNLLLLTNHICGNTNNIFLLHHASTAVGRLYGSNVLPERPNSPHPPECQLNLLTPLLLLSLPSRHTHNHTSPS